MVTTLVSRSGLAHIFLKSICSSRQRKIGKNQALGLKADRSHLYCLCLQKFYAAVEGKRNRQYISLIVKNISLFTIVCSNIKNKLKNWH